MQRYHSSFSNLGPVSQCGQWGYDTNTKAGSTFRNARTGHVIQDRSRMRSIYTIPQRKNSNDTVCPRVASLTYACHPNN